MIETDQTGYSVHLLKEHVRIISLVPSQTELIIELGAASKLVGRTKFCTDPKEIVKDIAIVGGTKKLNFEKIEALKPDLIIGNKEENDREQIEFLRSNYRIWISDIKTFDDAIAMIYAVGEMVKCEAKSETMALDIEAKFKLLKEQLLSPKKQSVLYLIWQNPWMAAGPDTFINDMICRCGFTNLINEDNFDRYPFLEDEGSSRYPAFTDETLVALNPDVILLSSEPYPFATRYPSQLEQMLPQSKIMLVDGKMFSWYGSTMTKAPAYFSHLINQL